MNYSKGLRLLIVSLMVIVLASACTGPLTIKDENFTASNVCDGEGTLELRMEGGELLMTARDELQIFMLQSGMPSSWCHGLRHIWIGEATYAGHTFKSSLDDPLQFVVDREKGYYYEQGTGTITMPEGEVVTLP